MLVVVVAVVWLMVEAIVVGTVDVFLGSVMYYFIVVIILFYCVKS